MLFDPLRNLGKMLVLLPDIVFFAKVDKVNDRLCGEEKQRIYDFDLARHSELA